MGLVGVVGRYVVGHYAVNVGVVNVGVVVPLDRYVLVGDGCVGVGCLR